MSVTLIQAQAAQGYVESTSTSYASALAGAGMSAHSGVPLTFLGQSVLSGTYFIWQGFTSYSWSAAADETVVSAYHRLRNDQATGSGVSRLLEMREFNWGVSVGTSDFRTPAQLTALARRARVEAAGAAGGQLMRAGMSGADLETLDSSATLRYVLASSRNRLQNTPSGAEWNSVRSSAHTAGPAPILYATATTKHLLDLTLGAAVQLSDGTTAMVVMGGTAPEPGTSAVAVHDGSSLTTLDTFVPGSRRGAQAYAVCRDEADNIYVINRSGISNTLNCRAHIKASGTWVTGTLRTAALPTYDGQINNVAVAWHPQGGAAGTLVAVVGREAGPNTGTPLAFALINCDHLLTGSGSVLRGSGNADGVLVDASAPAGYNGYPNETSTLLDVVRAPDDPARGFVLSTAKHQELGANHRQSIARYVLNGSGTGFASTARTIDTVSGFSVKDADAKSRVLPVSASQVVTVNVSSSADFGVGVKHRQNVGTSSEFSVLADVRLAAQGIASMPAASVLSTSSAWDAVYDPASNLVWIYYFDAADGRRLMRTHVDLNTGQAGQDEVVVQAAVGAAGSTNHAIRIPRGALAGQQVLVTVANETSGGTHSLIHVADLLNLPPLQPVLGQRGNFDATGAATFGWEFRDPNPGDTQSAFQLEIYDDPTDTLIHDTGKTVSSDETYELTAATLDNGDSFRWRVRTWDAQDVEGPWSEPAFFATGASGNVTVVYPAADNEDGIVTADVTVQWEVTGATQDAYRVVAVRTADDVVHSDTGWVTSEDVTHTVIGLASEVEYRIEVTIRDTMVESSTGTRLVTPDYTSPDEPSVTVVGVVDDPRSDAPEATGGYVLVSVENPEPGVDISGLDGTWESGDAGWEAFDGTIEQSDEEAYSGTYSGKLTVVGTPAQAYFRTEAPTRSPVEPNKRYTVSYWAYSPDGWADLASAIDFFDSDGNYLTTRATGGSIAAATWEFQQFTASAPPGAATASYGPSLATNPPEGMVLYTDELYLRTAADTPVPTANEIWRRRAGSGDDYTLLAAIDPDSSYRDYMAASGQEYEYLARAIADTATADSPPATATVRYHGVWIHDPADAEGTIRRWLHGRAQRAYTERLHAQQAHFAGRVQPVTLFGEHQEDVLQIGIDAPEGPTHRRLVRALRDFHAGRRPVVVRDNRGRVMVATLSDYGEDDQPWGTALSVNATRVDAPNVIGGEG
jgi:hypothetical protein